MAVTIRLARHGRKKLPFYRIVAADKAMRRDGRYLELLGTVDTQQDPVQLTLKEDRVKYWVGVGAYPSPTVSKLIETKLPGYLGDIENKKLSKIRAARAKRKASAKKASSSKSKAK